MDILTAILIHLALPLAGIAAFLRIARNWRAQNAPTSAFIELFTLFFCYGGLLLVLLTSLFWQWSGVASLGLFFLLFVAPLIMIAIAVRLYRLPSPHPAQQFVRKACAWYLPLLLLVVLASLIP